MWNLVNDFGKSLKTPGLDQPVMIPSPHTSNHCLAPTEISQETAVNPVDIVSTLQSLQMLKYWKGKHLVLKRQVRNKVISLSSCCALLWPARL